MRVADNWASRPHCPPGDSGAVSIHKGLAMNVSPPKPARKVTVQLGDGGPGKIGTKGWFNTKP